MTAAGNEKMMYENKKIADAFREFWKEAQKHTQFIYKGRVVETQKISSFDLQFTQGDYDNDFNFHCQTLNLRIQLDMVEKPYIGEFYIKVTGQTGQEMVCAIKNNRIYIKDFH